MDKKIVIEVLTSMIAEKKREWAVNFIARELNSKVLEESRDRASVEKNIDAATFNIASAEKDINMLEELLKAQKG